MHRTLYWQSKYVQVSYILRLMHPGSVGVRCNYLRHQPMSSRRSICWNFVQHLHWQDWALWGWMWSCRRSLCAPLVGRQTDGMITFAMALMSFVAVASSWYVMDHPPRRSAGALSCPLWCAWPGGCCCCCWLHYYNEADADLHSPSLVSAQHNALNTLKQQTTIHIRLIRFSSYLSSFLGVTCTRRNALNHWHRR